MLERRGVSSASNRSCYKCDTREYQNENQVTRSIVRCCGLCHASPMLGGGATILDKLCPGTRIRCARRPGENATGWSAAARTGAAGGTRWQRRRRRRKGQYSNLRRATGRYAGAAGRSVHVKEFL